MNEPTSVEEFVELAKQLQEGDKTLFVNQSDFTPEDAIVSDEDTAGSVNMQVVRLLATDASDGVYWAEPLYDSGELEQLNVELDELNGFTRNVVTLKELENKKIEMRIDQDSIQSENEPS